MTDGSSRDSSSSAAHALGGRSWLGKGVLVTVVMALVALAATLASVAHAQVGGATYSGEFDGAGTDCGGGTIMLTLNDEGSAIVNIAVDGAMFGGVPIDDLSIDLDPVLEIADDGTFSQDYPDPVPLTVSGSFDGESVTGTIDVPVLSCAPTFSATTSAEMRDDEPDDSMDTPDDSMDAPDDGADEGDVEADTAMEALPATGSGAPGLSNDGSMTWLLVAGSLAGLGALGVGIAMRRRIA